MNLAPNVFLSQVGDRAIVLDLVRDKYIGLAPALARAALQLIGTPGCREDLAEARSKLLAQGILTDSPPTAREPPRRTVPGAPIQTLWPSDRGEIHGPKPIRPFAFLAVMRALAEASWSLRRRPFHETVAWVSAQPIAKPSPGRSPQVLLDEFFAARPWYPVKPICRLDALALSLHLRRNGCPGPLVFGVKLEPFQAHCWVQVDGAVLNEPHEIVAWFTPIMAA